MLKIENYINSFKIEIPDRWGELSPAQFPSVCMLMKELSEGAIDIERFRIQLALYLMNFESKGWPYQEEKQQLVLENIYRISEKIMFPLLPIKDKPNLYDLNLNFGANLMPQISIDKTILYGPEFVIGDLGIPITDLRAEEFCDAYEYYAAGAVNEMICALYRPERGYYNNFDNQKNIKAISAIESGKKQAVIYFFQYVMGYFHNSPFYSIVFEHNDKTTPGKLSFGLGGSIYNLAKSGYGSKEEVARLSVTEFFDLLVKQIIDTVNEWKSIEKDPGAIAEKTGIPIKVITKII